jgi:hypothetical protein
MEQMYFIMIAPKRTSFFHLRLRIKYSITGTMQSAVID